MNVERRERIHKIKDDIQAIIDEETAAFDNLPESLQNGDKGQAMNDAIDYLSNAIAELDNIE